jgi:hypothetical protein
MSYRSAGVSAKKQQKKTKRRTQMKKQKNFSILLVIMLGILLFISQLAIAKEQPQEWELINPMGVVEVKHFNLAPRLATLEGKTIVLRWNDKHNGNNFLDRVAELLKEKVPSAKVIKLYEIDKTTIKISGSSQESARIARVIKGLNADLVIAAQTD